MAEDQPDDLTREESAEELARLLRPDSGASIEDRQRAQSKLGRMLGDGGGTSAMDRHIAENALRSPAPPGTEPESKEQGGLELEEPHKTDK